MIPADLDVTLKLSTPLAIVRIGPPFPPSNSRQRSTPTSSYSTQRIMLFKPSIGTTSSARCIFGSISFFAEPVDEFIIRGRSLLTWIDFDQVPPRAFEDMNTCDTPFDDV